MNRLWTAIVLCGLALGGAMSTQGGLGQGRTSETAAVIITSVVDGDTVHLPELSQAVNVGRRHGRGEVVERHRPPF